MTSLMGVFMVLESVGLPLWAQYAGLGAGFMVALVGAGLILTALALSVQILRGQPFEAEAAEGVDREAPVSRSGLFWAMLAVVLPILSIPLLGFPVGAALSFTCVARAFGSRRWGLDLGIGLLLAVAAWYAFKTLGVQLGPVLNGLPLPGVLK
jgi:putative tricarboxylic transport membrane protein